MAWRFVRFPFLLFPLAAFGQFTHTGVVVDSTTLQPMPGVNVVMKGDPHTITNMDGVFRLQLGSPTANLMFSALGYLPQARMIHANKSDTVFMRIDPALARTPFIKAGIDLGLYGDATHAPYGGILNIDIQSIGNFRPEVNLNGKYWKEGYNAGVEMSVSRTFSRMPRWAPENLLLTHRSLEYGLTGHDISQTRLLFANELPHFFAIEAGVTHNNMITYYEYGWEKTSFVSPSIGAMKVVDIPWLRASLGMVACINFGRTGTMVESGACLQQGRAALIMKYYNNTLYNGVLFSMRIRVFSTEYYCCDSFALRYKSLNVLR